MDPVFGKTEVEVFSLEIAANIPRFGNGWPYRTILERRPLGTAFGRPRETYPFRLVLTPSLRLGTFRLGAPPKLEYVDASSVTVPAGFFSLSR